MQNIKYYEIPRENYTIVPNQIIQSQDLSDGAKILALYLLSLPKDWNICWNHIAKALKKSISTIQKYKSELVAFEFLKIEQLKDEKGRFLNKTCLLFMPFTNTQNSTSDPLRNLTASGSDTHIQNKEYIQNKEIIVTQRTHLYHTLIESFKNFKKGPTKEKLEDFLSGAELESGKKWVQYRKERFKIPAFATIKKLKNAKEQGWDIVKSVERCITNDYRGLFEYKPRSFTHNAYNSKKCNPQAESEEKEILQELLKSGWRFGESLEGILVLGKRVEEKDGRLHYAL